MKSKLELIGEFLGGHKFVRRCLTITISIMFLIGCTSVCVFIIIHAINQSLIEVNFTGIRIQPNQCILENEFIK